MALTGALGAFFWGASACVPFFIVYGVLYGSAGDSRWHECGHGTAFRTPWKNQAVYQLASFFMIRKPRRLALEPRPAPFRYHYCRPDPEIVTRRPPKVGVLALNLFGLVEAPQGLLAMLRYATGRLTADERDFIPEAEQPKVATSARVWTAIYVAVVAACFVSHSILPAMLIGLPRFYGAWHMVCTGVTQHIGLAEDVTDHRLNCRTVYMNPFSRFVYWNMNYHLEYHMYPTAPYHALPALHEAVKADCPPPYTGFWDAYREILPTLARQLRDPGYFVERALPLGAGAASSYVSPVDAVRTDVKNAPTVQAFER